MSPKKGSKKNTSKPKEPKPKKELTESEKLQNQVLAYRKKLLAAKGTPEYTEMYNHFNWLIEERDRLRREEKANG